MNQRKLGILFSYFNIALQVIIGFLYVPILLHYIGKSEYGLYQLVGSLIAYFSIMDFGLSAAVIRFYAKYKALKDYIGMENILAISVRGYGAVTVLALAIGFGCYSFLDVIFAGSMTVSEVNEAKQIFLLLLLNIVVTLSTMVFRSVINAHERFFFLKGMETVQLIMQPILVVLVLQHHSSAFSVAAVQTVLNLLLSGARVYYCFRNLHVKIRFHDWNHELFSEFKKLALSVFAVSLIDQVFWKTNQIILGVISGTTAVAVYSIASLIYMNYMALSTAISGVYLPHVTGMVAKRESVGNLSELFIQIGRWQYYLLALVATGFIIFGKQFISFWAGSGFDDAYVITLLIILPFTIDLIQNIGLAILQAMNRYDFRARVYFLTGILNLALAIPLGIKYGGIGCAVATGISMIVGNGLIMNWYYAKEIHLAISTFWKQVGKISIVTLVCLIIGYVVNAYVWSHSGIACFLIKVSGYTLLYLIMIYGFAMSQLEKKKIQAVLKKVHIR